MVIVHRDLYFLYFIYLFMILSFLSSRLLNYIHPEVLNIVYTVEDTPVHKTIALIMIYLNSQALISLHCTNAFLLKSSHTYQFISVNEAYN